MRNRTTVLHALLGCAAADIISVDVENAFRFLRVKKRAFGIYGPVMFVILHLCRNARTEAEVVTGQQRWTLTGRPSLKLWLGLKKNIWLTPLARHTNTLNASDTSLLLLMVLILLLLVIPVAPCCKSTSSGALLYYMSQERHEFNIWINDSFLPHLCADNKTFDSSPMSRRTKTSSFIFQCKWEILILTENRAVSDGQSVEHDSSINIFF